MCMPQKICLQSAGNAHSHVFYPRIFSVSPNPIGAGKDGKTDFLWKHGIQGPSRRSLLREVCLVGDKHHGEIGVGRVCPGLVQPPRQRLERCSVGDVEHQQAPIGSTVVRSIERAVRQGQRKRVVRSVSSHFERAGRSMLSPRRGHQRAGQVDGVEDRARPRVRCIDQASKKTAHKLL